MVMDRTLIGGCAAHIASVRATTLAVHRLHTGIGDGRAPELSEPTTHA